MLIELYLLASSLRPSLLCFSSQDWKAQLNIPAPDTRYRTEASSYSYYFFHVLVYMHNVSQFLRTVSEVFFLSPDYFLSDIVTVSRRMSQQQKAMSLKIIF
jgi:hypothetical protein